MKRSLRWCAAGVVASMVSAAACSEGPTATGDTAGSSGAGRSSSGHDPGGAAGSSVLAGHGGRLEPNAGGSAGANGGTSGAGATGGASPAGGEGGDSRAGSGAGPQGGSAGERAVAGAGAGGEAGDSTVDPPAACGDVTMLGHCVGEVYEWCDYFASGIKRIDCGALGMRCEANPDELGNDFPTAGCFGDACTADDERCDGTHAYQCSPDGLTVHDCSKRYGPDTTCGPGQLGAGTCSAPHCEPDRRVHCDGNVAVICALDNNFYVEDCAEHDPAGTCTEIDPAQVECGGRTIQP